LIKNKSSFITSIRFNHFLPISLVLVVAVVTRFWNFSGLPFMHDEFSALFRTEFDNFSDLIRLGVMENDTHPAGVQVFLYYWVKMVGFNEFWIKLPFAFVGVITVWLFYSIGKQWFNETVGLVGASLIACTQFFVFYSQLARPYSMGLFAVMLLVYFWTKIINSDKQPILIWFFFAFALFFAAVMHAFSMFAALIVYLSGFWLLKPANRKLYIYAALVASILYSPHIPVFYFQLTESDLGGWLGEPSTGFLFEFLYYCLHYSVLFSGLVIGLVGLSVITMDKQSKKLWRFRMIGIVWFSVSFLTAYFYSIYRTPIIQFSTLYFTFPFLIIAVFSFFKPLNDKHNLLIVLSILLIGTTSLVFQRRHYELMYHQGYDQVAELAAKEISVNESVSAAFYSSTPRMVEYYLKREEVKNFHLFSKHVSTLEFQRFVNSETSESFILALTDGGPADWIEIVRNKYPYLLHHASWFNTGYYLFTKSTDKITKSINQWNYFHYIIDNPYFDLDIDNAYFSPERVYGKAWQVRSDTLFDKKLIQLLNVAVNGMAKDTLIQTKIVLELQDIESGKILHWQAATLNNDTILPGETFFLTTILRSDLIHDLIGKTVLRTYIWNPDKSEFVINRMIIGIREQSPKFYGLFEPI
jgi:hypothetical protein